MKENAIIATILTYYAVSLLVGVSGWFFPADTELITFIPVFLSVALLLPIYFWQKNYRKKTELPTSTSRKDKGTMLFWIFALFALALSVRIPSVLLFGEPYEKTPLIYLLIIAILVIEKTDLSTFGFKTKNLGKSLGYGLLFFGILGGFAIAFAYALIYAFTSQMPIQHYDALASLLVMPFMILCVGISEEGLFRGYMQTHLEKFYTSKQAIVFQAILFGIWHFVWNLHPFDPFGMIQYVITTFFIGLLFGYFYSKTRNLVPLVFAHGLWNSVFAWIIWDASTRGNISMLPLSKQVSISVLPFIVSSILTFVYVKYLVKEV